MHVSSTTACSAGPVRAMLPAHCSVAPCCAAQVIHQKHKKSLEEITNDLCPVLSVQQLYRISTMYWDDRYNTETVAHEVRCFAAAYNRHRSACCHVPCLPSFCSGWMSTGISTRCTRLGSSVEVIVLEL